MLLARSIVNFSRPIGQVKQNIWQELCGTRKFNISTSVQDFYAKNLSQDNDEEAQNRRPREAREDSLTRTVTPEIEKQIVGDSVGQKFILKQVLSEIINGERLKYPLPLPASLTVEQWRTLLSFIDRRSRFLYLDSLKHGQKTLEEIREFDEKFTKPLHIPQEMLDEALKEAPDDRKKIDMFLMYHEIARQAGEDVTPELKLKDLKNILKIHSTKGYQKYINFLNKRSFDEMKDMRRKSHSKELEKEKVKSKKDAIADNSHIFYGLGQNTIKLRLSEANMKKESDWRVWREFSLNSTPLVVDFSYASKLQNHHRMKSLIQSEAGLGVKLNKEAKTPFPLYFTGVSPDIQQWMKKVYCIDEDGTNFPVEITDKLQTELFPRERLVYLSPDSKNDLIEFNDDDIYVIGGIIDKGVDHSAHTLANAKRNKIRHARFPMRRTIGLVADLNVETCIAILNDLKYSNDWFYALRWVPSRYFYTRATAPGASQEHKLAYRAVQVLSPSNMRNSAYSEKLLSLSPGHYRELYRQVMEAKNHEETTRILENLRK